jgi:hypothetical protein
MATNRAATEWQTKRQTLHQSQQISHFARRGGKCVQVLQFMGFPRRNIPDQPIKIKVPLGGKMTGASLVKVLTTFSKSAAF